MDINNLVWCFNIIAFSHLFRDAEKGSIWKYLSAIAVLLGTAIITFN